MSKFGRREMYFCWQFCLNQSNCLRISDWKNYGTGYFNNELNVLKSKLMYTYVFPLISEMFYKFWCRFISKRGHTNQFRCNLREHIDPLEVVLLYVQEVVTLQKNI